MLAHFSLGSLFFGRLLSLSPIMEEVFEQLNRVDLFVSPLLVDPLLLFLHALVMFLLDFLALDPQILLVSKEFVLVSVVTLI